MKVELKSDHPVTNEVAKAATGKTFPEWFAIIDQKVEVNEGRAAVNNFLYKECKVDPWWCATINIEYEAHHQKVQSDGLPKGYTICVTKSIGASVADAYGAWTAPARLSAWFGPNAKADPRDGGTFETSDGNRGSYKRVRANKDLRFTWEHPDGGASIVDVLFQDKGKGKVGVMVTHDRIQGRPAADGLRAAWGGALEALKRALEA